MNYNIHVFTAGLSKYLSIDLPLFDNQHRRADRKTDKSIDKHKHLFTLSIGKHKCNVIYKVSMTSV